MDLLKLKLLAVISSFLSVSCTVGNTTESPTIGDFSELQSEVESLKDSIEELHKVNESQQNDIELLKDFAFPDPETVDSQSNDFSSAPIEATYEVQCEDVTCNTLDVHRFYGSTYEQVNCTWSCANFGLAKEARVNLYWRRDIDPDECFSLSSEFTSPGYCD